MVLVNVVLPVFLVFAAGYLLQKKANPEIKTLSDAVFCVLLPCLVFRTLYAADLPGTLKTIALFQLVLTASLIVVVRLVVLLCRLSKGAESALLLTVVFMNAGNYGMPFNLFAFGPAGFELAVTFFVFQSVLMNSLGVWLASRHRFGSRRAFRSVLSLPVAWAGVAGAAWQLTGLAVPSFLFKTVDLLAGAATPLVMLLLGMQLARIRPSRLTPGPVVLGALLRLAVSPFIAFLLIRFVFPVEGLPAKILLVQSAMPTAVVTTLLAVQYEVEPETVSAITLATTLLSVLTLPLLLYLLG